MYEQTSVWGDAKYKFYESGKKEEKDVYGGRNYKNSQNFFEEAVLVFSVSAARDA